MNFCFPVDDASRVAEIRRAAATVARAEGLDEIVTANVEIVATEASTNLVKHAQGGEIFLSALSDRRAPGVEILAIDRGPGVSDLAQCLADGSSSTNTAGTGLGAMARLSQIFDFFSQPGKGTVLVSQISASVDGHGTEVGAVLKPMAGEHASGDAWAFVDDAGGLSLVVADGLGHGLMAARASAEAISAFRRSGEFIPLAVLTRVHGALRGTRGAAVATAHLERGSGRLRYAGLGNINGVIVHAGKPVVMVSHNGTAGFHAPRLQEFSYALPSEPLVVMHSDGLSNNWNLDDYPGLRRRHPAVIAGVLYRDASRNRDDVCVVVARVAESA